MVTLLRAAKFPSLSWRPRWRFAWPSVPLLYNRRLPVPPRRVVMWSVVSAVPMGAVILMGAYLSYNLHLEMAVSRERVEQTHEVLAVLNQLFISLQDAETGQRGFVITGNDSYLTPYAEAVTALAPTMARLHELTSDSETQSIRIRRLETLTDSKLAEVGRTIGLRRTAGFQAAAADIVAGDGKDLMDDVRREVALIGAAERMLLRERQAIAKERERDVIRLGIAVALLSVATRIGLALMLVRLRKRRAAANLRLALAAAKKMRE